MTESRSDLLAALNGLLDHGGEPVAPEINLFEAGLIDSLGMLDLVDEVEAHFGLVLEQSDITIDNFASLGRIADLVGRRR